MMSRGPRRNRLLLTIGLYPFAAAAVAVNLFMLGLALHFLSLSALSPRAALLLALPLGVPASWLAARWIGRLVAEADGQPDTPPAARPRLSGGHAARADGKPPGSTGEFPWE
ncbi:MAG: hypothetical protein R3D85_07665 [Paracoccaceae bacterium]